MSYLESVAAEVEQLFQRQETYVDQLSPTHQMGMTLELASREVITPLDARKLKLLERELKAAGPVSLPNPLPNEDRLSRLQDCVTTWLSEYIARRKPLLAQIDKRRAAQYG